MQAESPLLAVQGIIKRFGDIDALQQVAFSVRSGEVLGLIGPNGSGKTTLLECVAGLQPTDGGEVVYRGQRLLPRQRRSVLFCVPENVVPYPDQFVRQVFSFFADVFSKPRAFCSEVVDTFDLASAFEKRVGQLSKGERRRLLLAIGWLTPQPILLMDEPFDGLDLRQTRHAISALRTLTAVGRTLVVSIHQLADAERACDRFVLLTHGRVVGDGTLTELRSQAGLAGGSLEDVFLALS